MDLLFLLVAVGIVVHLHNKIKTLEGRVDQLQARLQHGSPAPETVSETARETDTAPAPETPAPSPQTKADSTVWERKAARDRKHALAQTSAPAPRLSATVDAPPSAPKTEPKTPSQPLLTPAHIQAAQTWLKDNWFYAIAALCLMLSAVFFVQYGIENGLLTPFWRVMGALSLGGLLIVAGEILRRRAGDGAREIADFLPSTFSGSGIVALFIGVLSARALYGLISAETAMIGLVMISLLAVVFGWFYGPFLAVIGLLGATSAPFLVGGEGGAPEMYFYYFALIAVIGLAIDAVKKWGWVSLLAVALPYGAVAYVLGFGGGDVHGLAFAMIVALAAVILPNRRLTPDHSGRAPIAFQFAPNLWPDDIKLPDLAGHTALLGMVGAHGMALWVIVADRGPLEVATAFAVLAILTVLGMVWMRRASALLDLAWLAPAMILGALTWHAMAGGAIFAQFKTAITRPDHISAPATVLWALGMGALAAGLAFWRARLLAMSQPNVAAIWAAGSAAYALLMVAVLEFAWAPGLVHGAGIWASYVIAMAALMTFMAERIARMGPKGHLMASFYAVAALSLISLALMLMLTKTALSLALAATMVMAALLDRKFDLPLIPALVKIGVAVISWRMVIDPGVEWAVRAPSAELALSHFGVLMMMAATWALVRAAKREGAVVALESAGISLGAVVVSIWLERLLGDELWTFWGMSMTAMVWAAAGVAQFYRCRVSQGIMRHLRRAAGVILIGIGTLAMGVALTILNPLGPPNDDVFGPFLLDTLLLGYGVPAMMIGALAWRWQGAGKRLRLGLAGLSAMFAALYVGLEIRRFWRGDILWVPGTTAPELYTYTVAMMIAAVALLLVAYARRSEALYRAALIGIGITIAKVFFVDMSGLVGLYRVASFLGLGLALAGLAWLNTQMRRQWAAGMDAPEQISEDGA